jgi:uncharacterized protein
MPLAIMLTKEAIPGQVKTRLASEIGDREAAEVHQLLALATAGTLLRSGIPTAVSFDGDLDSELARHLRNMGHRVFQQPSGDLGQRIHHALHRAERCIAIGSDCPLLGIEDIQAAAKSDRLVLGPSDDGGYWLIAASRPPWALFEHIPWSTERVYSETCSRAGHLNMPHDTLSTRYDIDTRPDLLRLLGDPSCPSPLNMRLASYA